LIDRPKTLDEALEWFNPKRMQHINFPALHNVVGEAMDDLRQFGDERHHERHVPAHVKAYCDEALRSAFAAGWEACHRAQQDDIFERGFASTSSYLMVVDAMTKFKEAEEGVGQDDG
jgi:hypothetical protein